MIYAGLCGLLGCRKFSHSVASALRQVAIKVIEVDEEDTSGFADEAKPRDRRVEVVLHREASSRKVLG